MNRIARQTIELSNATNALAGYSRLMSLLRQHLPARIATLYAQPRSDGAEVIEWLTETDGQALPFSTLPVGEAQNLRHIMQEKLAAVRQLAEQLAPQLGEDHADVQLLRQASHVPDDSVIYVQNGQPVITCWGKPAPELPVAVPLAASVGATVATRRLRWWWLLLLLLLLALLAWWFWPRTPDAVPIAEVEPVKLQVIESAPVGELPPLGPSTFVEPPVAPASPIDKCIAAEEAAGRGSEAASHCKRLALDNVKSLCPEDRTAELAPQVVVILDASGSMILSMDATREELSRIDGDMLPANLIREPRRISVARKATSSIINQLPSDMTVGLVSAENCGVVKSSGFFSASQRPKLIRTINHIEPDGKTPLAEALRKAGKMVDGVNRDAIILLVSDGDETCGGDPCKVAAELKRLKPRLVVNVVDILGAGAGNCVAQSTGGKVFTANKSDEINDVMKKAMASYIPQNCSVGNGK
ncbi:VWA domain-containing protein [Rouxiella sp. Mn2063]|uniref:VWA domain-containing protein n=1 Tax=Rouxiella sp. Mn2063 TaxID=3395262 RepID=UPI003BDC2ED0